MKEQNSRENQAIVREAKKDKLISRIPLLTWDEDYNLLFDFCNSDIKLELNDIKRLLNIEDKSMIDVFLQEYILFDENDKAYLELFIDDNLEHENTEYVSDLLYFATDWSLNINYLKVLNLIKNHAKDENYVVLGAINYISNNIKYYYIEEIVSSFNSVVNSSDYFQSEQVLASISLYRITRKQSFLDFVVELIDYDNSNLVFLTNLLGEKSYREEYFDLTEIRHKVFKKISSKNI
ncbi:MAG: hypothetical protein LBI72_01745 [Flavobacteriaceae bacterium]|jgi:hypothetical protein|nr:hypothetical protein [Flavobacteriaceae bacterium]